MRKLALIILFYIAILPALAVDLGNGVEYIPPSRKLGVGTKTPPEQLSVNGNLALKTSSSLPNGTSGYGVFYVNASNIPFFVDSSNNRINLANGADFSAANFLRSNTSTSYSGTGTITFDSGTGVTINSSSLSIADPDISFSSASGVSFSPASNQNLNINLAGSGNFSVETNRLVVANNGNVGIRDSSPDSLLDINGTMLVNGTFFRFGSLSQGSILYASSTSNLTALTKGSDNYVLKVNGNKLGWEPDDTGLGSAPGGTDGNLQFKDGSSFSGNGSLSFNKSSRTITVAPTTVMDLNSTSLSIADPDISFSSATGVSFSPASNQNLNINLAGSGNFSVETNRLVVANNGNVGIGIANPSSFRLELNGGHLGPSKTNSVNLGSSSKRFNSIYAKENIFDTNGGVQWGTNKSKSFKTYYSTASVNATTAKTLTDMNGDNFSFTKTYRVTAHNPDVSSSTGAMSYFIGNGNSGFTLIDTEEAGTGTDHIDLYLDSNTPKVKLHSGATLRNIQLLIEESPTYGSDSNAFGPLQDLVSPAAGTITLRGRESGTSTIFRIINRDDNYASETLFGNTNSSGSGIEKWSVGSLGDSHASGSNRFYIYQYKDKNDSSVARFRMLVSDNGNFHFNLMGSGVNDNNGRYVFNGVTAFKEEASTPSSSTGYGKIYVASSDKELYFRASDQSAVRLTNNGSLAVTSGATNIDSLSDGKADTYSVFLGSGAGDAHSGNTYSTAVGIDALKNNNGGSLYNAALGYQALMTNNGGDYNTAIGYQALKKNTKNGRNTAIGAVALQGNTLGYDNTALGAQALMTNSTGYQNTAIGLGSLGNNTTGYINTAVGESSLGYNTTGFANSAFGEYSLGENFSGNNNAAFGYGSANMITTGSYNAAFGSASLWYADNGSSNNTALGYRAGEGTDLPRNEFSNGTFLGFETGSSITTGDNNILIGYRAGDNITSGATNLIIGYDNDAPSATGSNQIDIADTIFGNSSTRNVGIGINNVSSKLTVNGDFAMREISSASASSGYGVLYVKSGDQELYFDNSGHSEIKITNNGSLAVTSGATNIDGLSDAKADTYSVFLGSGSGNSHSGNTYSTAVGIDALNNNNNNCLYNTAVGYQALMTNIGTASYNGDFNSAFGYQALMTNSGFNNSAFGKNSLRVNTSGWQNTAVGAGTLELNTTGHNNTAVGIAALSDNVNGIRNTALGSSALASNTSGSNNVSVGIDSLILNTTGDHNVAIGNSSLFYNTDGPENVAIGSQAGLNSTGGYNTLIGYQAGVNLTYGDSNIIIGNRNSAVSSSGSNQLDIGDLIYGDLSGKRLGVGISSIKTGVELDVNGDLMVRKVFGFNGEVANTSSATITVDWTKGNRQSLTLSNTGVTVNFTDPPLDSSLVLVITQDATGSRTISTWDTDIKWPNGTAPTLTTTANAIDMISCLYRSNPKMYLCTASLKFQ